MTLSFKSESIQSLSGVLVTMLVGSLIVYVSRHSPIWPFVAFFVALQLGCILAFMYTSKRSLQVILFWAEAVCLLMLNFLVYVIYSGILTIVWIVQASELFPPRQAFWLLIAGVIAFAGSQVYHFAVGDLLEVGINIAMICLLQVFSFAASQRAIRESKLRKETGALNLELIATRELLAQSTAENERVRIARDLHDILGHHMTALILNLEAAKHCVKDETQDLVKSREKVEQSLALAKLLLGDIRTAVSELRDGDSIDLEQSIKRMITGIPRCKINVDFSSAPQINDLQLAETMLRCTQEAITNVLRHSNATTCQIKLSAKNDRCVLEVSDNGEYKKEITPGNGMRGMEERVTASGGTLSWQHTLQGFCLRVELAVNQNA